MSEEETEAVKRPMGLTIIAVVWLIGGIVELYVGAVTINDDLEVLPLLSDPDMPDWFRFGVPAQITIYLFIFALGLVRLCTIYGLWTGRSWSYKLAMPVPVLNVIGWMLDVGLLMSAPVEFGLRESISWSSASSILWVIIYWGYLRRPHVKRYLHVIGERDLDFDIPNTPIIKVTKVRLIKGNTQYALLFARNSLIAAKIGGQFSDPNLNIVSVRGKLKELSEMPIEEVVDMDEDNFRILSEDIAKIEVKKSSFGLNGARAGVLQTYGRRKERFDIWSDQNFEDCRRILEEYLPGRVIVR